VTSPERSSEALDAASKIQRLWTVSKPRSKEKDQAVEETWSPFRRFDFPPKSRPAVAERHGVRDKIDILIGGTL